jgi:hypothetical protein
MRVSDMTRKTIARNSGKSGRVNVSGSELNSLGIGIGDEIIVDAVDSKAVAHALIDTRDTDQFLIVTPA